MTVLAKEGKTAGAIVAAELRRVEGHPFGHPEQSGQPRWHSIPL